MIVITESKLQYKALDGGVTRRVPEHFAKRSVRYELNGVESRIDINKTDLPITATEDEVIAYIKANTDKSVETNQQVKMLQETVDQLVLDGLMRGLSNV